MRNRKLITGIVMITFFGILASAGAENSSLPDRKLIVGTKEVPPFAMKTHDGKWTGISIDLWRRIATHLNLAYEFRETDLKGLLDGVANRSLDVGVAALTITAEREKELDFTHSFYTTGLGIAVALEKGDPWLAVLERFLSPAFLKIVAALSLLLLAVGILVWWLERRSNPNQFGGSAANGIASGFWWSAVTMTTVGYGDKAPVTFGGRMVALIWMFTAIILISGFTAAITSSLTVTELASPIQGPADLPKVRVGSVSQSTGESYLRDNRISFRSYRTSVEGLGAIADGRIDALVYDAPSLQYLVNRDFQAVLRVLPNKFSRQDYGIALPQGSLLREPFNRVLLEKIREPVWQDILYRYLGE